MMCQSFVCELYDDDDTEPWSVCMGIIQLDIVRTGSVVKWINIEYYENTNLVYHRHRV